jgi:hypothetical protein
VAVTVLVIAAVGCRGSDEPPRTPGDARPTVPAIGPSAKETVDAALKRFTPGACRRPAEVFHSSVADLRAVAACRRVVGPLQGSTPRVSAFRTGATATVPGKTFALALDTDRRWRIAFSGPESSARATGNSADDVANLAVSALSRDNCEELVPYAFVYLSKSRWCGRPAITRFVKDLERDVSPAPRRLGASNGLVFYGVPLDGPHYWTLVVAAMRNYHVYYDSYRAQ